MQTDNLKLVQERRMKWAVMVLAGFLTGCATQQDKAFVQDQITGWIVECGPQPISITFCIDFYKERGYVEVSAP